MGGRARWRRAARPAAPRGLSGLSAIGLGALAGIGFTVSLFTELAYTTPELIDAAKIGVLSGSVVAAAIGVATLLGAGPAESG